MSVVLEKIRVAFPVLKFQVTITHSTPRIPTAFERIVLVLCDRLGNHPRFKTLTLAQVFEDFLCVADPIPLVRPTLESLIQLKLITCRVELRHFEQICLEDLALTNQGQKVLRDNLLPGRSRTHQEEFVFDPVRNEVLSDADASGCCADGLGEKLNIEVFKGVFPETSIRKRIQSGAFSWWNSGGQIVKLEPNEEVTTLWREVPATVLLDEGHILFQTTNQRDEDYLKGLSADELYERFLKKFMVAEELAQESMTQWPQLSSAAIQTDQVRVLTLSRIKECSLKISRWGLLNPDVNWDRLAMRSERREIVVRFDPTKSENPCRIASNPGQEGGLFTLGGPWPLAPHILFVSDLIIVRGFRVSVILNDETIELPLLLEQEMPVTDLNLGPVWRELWKRMKDVHPDAAQRASQLWEALGLGEQQVVGVL